MPRRGVLSTCARELCVVAIPPFAEANVAQLSEADCRAQVRGLLILMVVA
jgi:hypothetical protein